MIKKLLYKLIWIIIGLIIGSIIIFLFSQYVPFDGIENRLVNQGITPDEDATFNSEYEKLYIAEHKNLPLFYFSILPHNYHPNYRSIINKAERNLVLEKQRQGYIIQYSHISTSHEITNYKIDVPIPKIHWHGLQNQYHYYFNNILKGELGSSRKDNRPVVAKISSAINWTLITLLLSLIIVIPLSFIMSFFLMKKKYALLKKTFLIISSIIFSIPVFVFATFVLIFFTGNQYGIQIFYSPLYLPIHNNEFMEIIKYGLPKVAPVVFCNIITDTFFLTYLLRNNMLAEYNKSYTLAAKARGNSENQIIIKHIIPNVLIPFVTLLVNTIPIALAGSIVYELVFNIPGMGKLLYDAVYNADWNVVYGMVLFIMIITSFVYIIGDILYKIIDPRVR
jgi:peptide/nickel transport system permease protein